MNPRLTFKLALISIKRSPVLHAVFFLSFAQLIAGAFFCGAVESEISQTLQYAKEARLLTIQMKEEGSGTQGIHDLLGPEYWANGETLSFEELKTQDVLKTMEIDEPDVVQAVKAVGNEGLNLIPKLVVIRGVFPNFFLEGVKALPEVYRVDVSPVHHRQLLDLYRRLRFQIRGAMGIILFILLAQFLALARIQARDLNEVFRDLTRWGIAQTQAKLPAWVSLALVSVASFLLAGVEWIFYSNLLQKSPNFLGELSITHHFAPPVMMVVILIVAFGGLGLILGFSGQHDPDF